MLSSPSSRPLSSFSPFPPALLGLFQSAHACFPFLRFPKHTPFPRRPVRLPLFVKRAPGFLPVISFTGIPFLLLYPPYLLCSRLFFFANLVFLRINYAAHPSPSLHQRPFPFSEANPLRVFSCPLAVFMPCSYALSCLRRLLCPVWFSQRKTPPRPRFLPFFAQNKRGRPGPLFYCAVLFFLSASIQSGRYFSTLALCSSSVLLNTVSPVSGSPRQKYKYPFK